MTPGGIVWCRAASAASDRYLRRDTSASAREGCHGSSIAVCSRVGNAAVQISSSDILCRFLHCVCQKHVRARPRLLNVPGK
jgi:hypothetical protein